MVATRLGMVLLAVGSVATGRCPQEEPAPLDDTCPTELADLQTEFDDLAAECTPGKIPSREGGVLVSADGGAVLNVPPGALPEDDTFTITPLSPPTGDVVVASSAYDISGNEVTQLDEPVTICLRSSGTTGDDTCLGYLDASSDPPSWRCEDECLEKKGDLLCGETSHFTNFAILLSGSGSGSGKCGGDDNYLLSRREGGVVRSADGVAFVSVPPGALPSDTTFTITPGKPPKADVARLTDVYTFGPDGLKFAEPARVCLGGAPSDSKAGCLGFIDETVEPPKWVCSDPCLKRVDGTICGKADHFTSFAILLEGGLSDVDCLK